MRTTFRRGAFSNETFGGSMAAAARIAGGGVVSVSWVTAEPRCHAPMPVSWMTFIDLELGINSACGLNEARELICLG